MPLAEPFLTGAPCWADLMTTDPDRAVDFYSSVFGWRAERAPEEFGGYINFFEENSRVCGCPGQAQPGAPVTWNVYLRADDAAATLNKVEAAGGQIAMPAMQVGDLGTMAFVLDPDNAMIGVWQPGTHRGFTTKAEPGTVGWFELHTRAYEKSIAFYQTVFGWDTYVTGDTPDFRFTTLGSGEQQSAGIMDSSTFGPEALPAKWSVYFNVADVDGSIGRIIDAGGLVISPAEDTPYGRLAEVVDPLGATFKLMST